MIILGSPRTDEMENYYMADGDMIWELDKAGFIARFMDGEVKYYKLNSKLKKFLAKFGGDIK